MATKTTATTESTIEQQCKDLSKQLRELHQTYKDGKIDLHELLAITKTLTAQRCTLVAEMSARKFKY